MKRYSLIPKDISPTLEGIADEVEAGGKLVLPMVNGIYTLAVEDISAEDARLFRKAQASIEAPQGKVEETLPATLLPPVAFTEEQILAAAEAAHEANRAYCQSIGDDSQPAWADAPPWQAESAYNGVRFAIANNFPSPEAMHENWMAEKLAAGWVYGAEKRPEILTHPNLVPHGLLPEAQRKKDEIFRATIIASLGAAA